MNCMNLGKVYLVGAGPGDPKLITLRGLEAVRKADVVVYDRLASPRILEQMRTDAEKIYVGKLPDRHTMKQEDINQLLVDLALEGKVVTRLKGGDPCIFGRVGEEAELLVQHGIEFEIVPGITSAVAVPAYAGIPVTHRDFASSLSLVTGHEKPEKLDTTIHWESLPKGTDTLIFLMGVAKLGYIRDQLIANGRTPDTPIALIRWGTRVEQQTLVGTLATIVDQVEQADFKPPAIIIVGEVVKLRDKLSWYEKKPLFGKRILVTRARKQASELVERIDDWGGEPLEFPVIKIQAQSHAEQIEQIKAAYDELNRYDWVIFTSPNGVEYFYYFLQQFGCDIRSLGNARIAAVGPKTAEELNKRGIQVEALPEHYTAVSLVEGLKDQINAGDNILLPRGNLADTSLPDALRSFNCSVTDLDVYETVLDDRYADEVIEYLNDGDIQVITFTSSSTVRNLVEVLSRSGVEAPAQLINQAQIAVIGPSTQATAELLGVRVDVVAKEATIDALLHAVAGLNPSHLKEEAAQ